MKAGSLIKRYICLFLGFFVMTFGIAFSIKADLGTTPISSLPYVVSVITPLSVGTATIIMHCVFILCQILILRKDYEIVQLLQLPVALVFGALCDFALFVLSSVTYSSYIGQWVLCIIGIVLMAVGVSMEVAAGVVTVAGEGFVLALCKKLPIKFGNMKVIFDMSLLAIAVILGLASEGRLIGVREGTVAAAVFVGLLSKKITIPIYKILRYIGA